MDNNLVSLWEEYYVEWLAGKLPEIENYVFWSGKMATCVVSMGENPSLQSMNYWLPILYYCTEKYNQLIYERNNLK